MSNIDKSYDAFLDQNTKKYTFLLIHYLVQHNFKIIELHEQTGVNFYYVDKFFPLNKKGVSSTDYNKFTGIDITYYIINNVINPQFLTNNDQISSNTLSAFMDHVHQKNPITIEFSDRIHWKYYTK